MTRVNGSGGVRDQGICELFVGDWADFGILQ
jgi:hypothetical protein